MIIARTHLEEFIDIAGVSNDEIVTSLVSIGHEVATTTTYRFDERIVVGKVLECTKHPEADKLNICQVLVGSETLQIVCGASNVAKDLFVPVALVGATMSDGLKIKEAELRGAKSCGMICSAKELGLPDLNNGILPLDSSIGDLIVGKQLNSYPLLADTFFELELTANRGDAFSVYGVARDLAAKLDISVRKHNPSIQNNIIKGVSRVLQLLARADSNSSVMIRVFENSYVTLPLLTQFRSIASDIKKSSAIETACAYITHTTGVLFRAFDLESFDRVDDNRYLIKIEKENGIDLLVGKDRLMQIGIDSNSSYFAKDDSKKIVVVAYHIDADIVSKIVWKNRLKTDDFYPKSAKGTDSDLEFAMSYFSSFFVQKLFYSEALSSIVNKEPHTITANIDEIYSIIGQKIEKNRLVHILKKVGISLKASADDNNFVITPPAYRPDLINIADIAEEVVRIMGIDTIESKPLIVQEIKTENIEYFRFIKERDLAKKAASNGFYETLNFVFCNKDNLEMFGYEPIKKDIDIANPITAELNTLRPTLLFGLLENAKKNSAKSRNKIALFEIGDVVDSNRVETREMVFVFSGKKELESVANHAKPQVIDLFDFSKKIAAIVGNISLDLLDDVKYLQSGQSAKIVLDGNEIGTLGKLHPKIAKHYDLDTTFVAQIDLAKIDSKTKQAKTVSKFQRVFRDITVLVDKTIDFIEIKRSLFELNNPLIEEVRAIDIFSDKSLGDKHSLTVRISILPFEKSLKDDEINGVVASLLDLFKSRFGAELR